MGGGEAGSRHQRQMGNAKLLAHTSPRFERLLDRYTSLLVVGDQEYATNDSYEHSRCAAACHCLLARKQFFTRSCGG